MTYRRSFLAIFSAALLLGLAWGCAAADDSNGTVSGGGGDKAIPDGGNDEQLIGSGGAPTDSDGGVPLNALCGKYMRCVPDAPRSCSSYQPPSAVADDASTSDEDASTAPDPTGSPSGSAGASGEGGAAGAPNMSLPSDGGAGGASSESAGASGAATQAGGAAGSSGEGGAAGAPVVDSATYGCQVQRVVDSPRNVVPACGVVGPGGAAAPCLTSSDCQAGFGCVGDQNAGQCQAYCCADADNCTQGKYCAERPMRDALINALPKDSTDTSSTLLIPVCVPAENCDLSEPYPCTAGAQCACKDNTACLVVRSDGTTTCAVPGAGKVGDACPCAWGHVCSAATNRCLQLCYTRGAETCGDGICQSASALPDGWGVCVGSTSGG